MNNKADFFQKKLSNTRSFTRQKKTSTKWLIVLLIVLIVGIGVTILIFRNATNSENIEVMESNSLSLGEEIYLQGNLKADGDLITYTHTITDEIYGEVGLKSSEMNLSDYIGFVELTGIVEKFNYEMPIVRVLELSGSLSDNDEDIDIVNDEKSGVYIMGAGIQFLPSFFNEYVLLNEGENGEILIQNIESGDEIAINYFRCNVSDPNRNCKSLSDTFESSSAQSFVTSEGDVYYKQSEGQSRFVANGNWWGIFINDVPDDVVYQLKDLMKFANEKNVNQWIKTRAMKICQGNNEKMQKIIESNVELKQEGLIATIKGEGNENMMTCQILVDFSLPNKGTLQSLTVGDKITKDEGSEIEEKSESENIKETSENVVSEPDYLDYGEWDPDVTQFPIKTEGGLSYSSSRGGYSLQFPSSNISFNASAVRESFSQDGLLCSYVINVIKYSDKESLEISPAVRVYECSSNNVVKSWAQNYIVYNVIGKIFVVQINDSSWIDFAKNLKFESLES